MPATFPPDTRICAGCDEPLPPHIGRGRPPLTHPGECRRLRRNRMQLQARIERYISAAGPAALDRSDNVRGVLAEDTVDYDDVHGDEALLGSTEEPLNPRYLPGKVLMAAIKKHEEQQAVVNRMRRQGHTVDPETRAKAALVPLIDYEEYRELLRRRPGTKPSPAFLAYEARREELDAALGQLCLAMTNPDPDDTETLEAPPTDAE